ncbi:fructosamine kinase family protein [Nocardia sp. 2]|uniref:Fructosamine kinase family protein n=1 Tax=Nocardia acididurans TaxID=2802282 RepID=A0ABS1M3M7_9NOCA|nr:fructosamine kinase family protein [Nocardia acididurans]MBL1073748.1 fructosamine kinase family protein [Nocardia acididurans]
MDVRGHLGELVGARVERLEQFGSSHAWGLYRGELRGGRSVFVKARVDGAAGEGGVFAAEAAGLRWLGAADAGLVPEVLAVDERMLVLPWVESGAASASAAERLGRELAGLHADSPGEFGASWPGWIAALPLDNSPSSGEWGSWYAERRLAPYLPAAARELGRDGVALVERVMDRIGALGGPAERPSRIHGDLWSGNVLWARGRAMLVDPAAHGGHRETDLAMLALFGAPHLDRILAGYQEVAPLAAGWRQRIPLHQLHPLLVHVVLFGSSYAGMTKAAAAAALAG